MRAYLIRRLLLIVPTLLLVTLAVFFLVRFIPGSVIDLMASESQAEAGMGTQMTPEYLRHALGLDEPIHLQYGRWLGRILQGDFGRSLWTDRAVNADIISRLPISLELGTMAIVIGMLIALPIGVYSAIRQDTAGDYAGRTFAIVLISVPSFWAATIVVVYPSIWWGWSPPIEYIPLVEDPVENIKQFILPAVIMGTHMSGTTMRMTRTMMLEVLRQDYIRTAWSKGLRERVVVMRHAVKNALIPVVTIAGMMIPVLIGGSVIMEQIFGLPGIGRLVIEAVTKRDYTVISGVNMVVATVVLLANLLVDLSYAYLDPRVRYG